MISLTIKAWLRFLKSWSALPPAFICLHKEPALGTMLCEVLQRYDSRTLGNFKAAVFTWRWEVQYYLTSWMNDFILFKEKLDATIKINELTIPPRDICNYAWRRKSAWFDFNVGFIYSCAAGFSRWVLRTEQQFNANRKMRMLNSMKY